VIVFHPSSSSSYAYQAEPLYFVQENPKKAGSMVRSLPRPLPSVVEQTRRAQASERYEAYKGATTLQGALDRGAKKADIQWDYEKGYLKFKDPKTSKLILNRSHR
jgi:hypothetical protein